MFESLTDRFDGILGRLKGKGRLTEDDVAEAMREIRLALLEADVHFNVVDRFIERTREPGRVRDQTSGLGGEGTEVRVTRRGRWHAGRCLIS